MANPDLPPVETQSAADLEIVKAVDAYIHEAEEAKRMRMEMNRRNWDIYHLRADWSHKQRGQSREFIPKQKLAVEQITQFVHQALVNLDRWFSVSKAPGNTQPLMTEAEVTLVLEAQLKHAQYFLHVQDSVKSGLLESLMTSKLGGKMVQKRRFKATVRAAERMLERESGEVWQLSFERVRADDYFPDPTGEGLYEIQQTEVDVHVLRELAEQDPQTWNAEAVEHCLEEHFRVETRTFDKAKEQGQNVAQSSYRKRVLLHEMWGTIVNERGEVLYEDVVCVVANRRWLVRKPVHYQDLYWHGQRPLVVAPFIRVAGSVWHAALMDAPTYLNVAQNELFNLMLDGALMDVFGIKQLRPGWLENAEDVADGIAPGMTLKVSNQCPPGMKVLERVDTGAVSNGSMQMYQVLNSEQLAAGMSNELRMGAAPERAVKATEVVEANQSLTAMLQGLTSTLEADKIQPELEQAWALCCQYFHDMDEAELKALLGDKRARELLAIPRSEFYARTVGGYDFSVFGLSQTMHRQQDFRKYSMLMQTIMTTPAVAEEVQKDYSIAKVAKAMVKTMGIREEEILADPADQAMNRAAQAAPSGALPGAPNMLSQVPQAAGAEQAAAFGGGQPMMQQLMRGEGGDGLSG